MIASLKRFWARHKHRYQVAVQRYGWPVVGVAILLNILNITLLVVLVKLGVTIEGVGGNAGLIGGAWVASKPFLPVRLALAVLIAPPLVNWVRRLRGLDPHLPPVVEDLDPEPAPEGPDGR